MSTPLSDVKLLTVAEVAKAARVSKMTIYRMVHSGELASVQVGRSYRVPEQAVLALFAAPDQPRRTDGDGQQHDERN